MAGLYVTSSKASFVNDRLIEIKCEGNGFSFVLKRRARRTSRLLKGLRRWRYRVSLSKDFRAHGHPSSYSLRFDVRVKLLEYLASVSSPTANGARRAFDQRPKYIRHREPTCVERSADGRVHFEKLADACPYEEGTSRVVSKFVAGSIGVLVDLVKPRWLGFNLGTHCYNKLAKAEFASYVATRRAWSKSRLRWRSVDPSRGVDWPYYVHCGWLQYRDVPPFRRKKKVVPAEGMIRRVARNAGGLLVSGLRTVAISIITGKPMPSPDFINRIGRRGRRVHPQDRKPRRAEAIMARRVVA
jgi:hypothetical protein